MRLGGKVIVAIFSVFSARGAINLIENFYPDIMLRVAFGYSLAILTLIIYEFLIKYSGELKK